TTPAAETICEGGLTSIILSNPNSVAGTTFTWTATSDPNVTGAADDLTGDETAIAQTLGLADNTPGTVTYTITPTSGAGCEGATVDVTVTVNPVPEFTNPPQATVICSGDQLGFTPTSDVAGAVFTWTSATTGNITGNTNGT